MSLTTNNPSEKAEKAPKHQKAPKAQKAPKKNLVRFRYSALDAQGKKVAGTEMALTSGAAHLALVERGYQPLEVIEKASLMNFEVTKKKVPRKEVMHFSRQLGVFMKAGIPIMEALEVIEEETTEKLMKKVLHQMIEDLRAGDTFAAAAASHPEAFPNFYVGILESAELTGNLDTVLNQLADYIERDVEARSTLSSALIYPGVVAVMSVLVVVVLATFVMPRFVVFFKSLHAKLPLPTRMLLSASSFFSHWWFLLIGALFALVIGFVAMRRSPAGKAVLDGLILKLPVLGALVQAAVLERICRVLSSMIRAGVDLPQAMAVTADAANNAVYKKGLITIREEMMEGQGLAAPLARTDLFPGAAQQMFRVGEETGTLDLQLETAAVYYHRELEVRVKHFTSLFEPAVIIFMGVVVGFVAVALISAMYGIYSQVKVT
jgi:type IV pilus assembly protein PilC